METPTETTVPEQSAPSKAEPVVTDPARVPAGKGVDFAAAHDEAAKDKLLKEKAPNQKIPEKQDKGTAKANKGYPEIAVPCDATRPKKEENVYLNLPELRLLKNHLLGVRDDAEMQGFVEAIRRRKPSRIDTPYRGRRV